MALNTLDTHMHASIHFLLHLILENYCISGRRNLAPTHPLHDLVSTPCLNNAGISSGGTRVLFNQGERRRALLLTARHRALSLCGRAVQGAGAAAGAACNAALRRRPTSLQALPLTNSWLCVASPPWTCSSRCSASTTGEPQLRQALPLTLASDHPITVAVAGLWLAAGAGAAGAPSHSSPPAPLHGSWLPEMQPPGSSRHARTCARLPLPTSLAPPLPRPTDPLPGRPPIWMPR